MSIQDRREFLSKSIALGFAPIVAGSEFNPLGFTVEPEPGRQAAAPA